MYAPIAGELHVYAYEWIDFPALALPWMALAAVGLMAGFRALGDPVATRLNRLLGKPSLGIVGIQILGATAFAFGAVASSPWVFP